MKTNDSKKQSVEAIKEKPSFVFYRSYFEAIETLSTKNRLIAYEAIVKYGLDKEETMDLPLRVLAILKMAIPNLDANRKKYFARVKGTPQANQKDKFADFEKDCNDEVSLDTERYEVKASNCFEEGDDTPWEP